MEGEMMAIGKDCFPACDETDAVRSLSLSFISSKDTMRGHSLLGPGADGHTTFQFFCRTAMVAHFQTCCAHLAPNETGAVVAGVGTVDDNGADAVIDGVFTPVDGATELRELAAEVGVGVAVNAAQSGSNEFARSYTLVLARLVGISKAQFGGLLEIMVAMSEWHDEAAHILAFSAGLGRLFEYTMLYSETPEQVIRSVPLWRLERLPKAAIDCLSSQSTVEAIVVQPAMMAATTAKRAWSFIADAAAGCDRH